MSNTKIIIAAVAALLSSQAAFAADGFFDSASVELGGGDKVQMLRLAGQRDWNQNWLASNGRHLSGYWDFNIAEWRGIRYNNVHDSTKYYTVIGVTPVFRYEADNKLGWYAEGGIGASLFSSLYRNGDKRLSTAYEFADHIGVGYALPNKWDFSARIQHYSNGGIKHPNSGVNWFVLKAAYRF